MDPHEIEVENVFKCMNIDTEKKRASYNSFDLKEKEDNPVSEITYITISTASEINEED